MRNSLRILVSCLAFLTPVLSGTAERTVEFLDRNAAGPDAKLVVPIRIDPANGVSSISLAFSYDSSVIAARGVLLADALGGWALQEEDVSAPGSVSIELAGPALAATGAVEIAWVVFDAAGGNGSASTLSWTSANFNGGTEFDAAEDGQISVEDERRVAIDDDLTAPAGGTLVIPVDVSETQGAQAFDIFVRFDSQVVTPISVSKTPLSSSLTLSSFLGIEGQVRATLFGINALPPGNGPVLEIELDLDGPPESVTPLILTRAAINEGQIATSVDDGLLGLCDPLAGAPEVSNTVRVDRSGGDAVLSWEALLLPGQYPVYRGTRVAVAPFAYDHACFGVATDDPTVTDSAIPPSATLFYYLVARTGACGPSGLGSGSAGSPRPAGAPACP